MYAHGYISYKFRPLASRRRWQGVLEFLSRHIRVSVSSATGYFHRFLNLWHICLDQPERRLSAVI
jgi:hypothetical protein